MEKRRVVNQKDRRKSRAFSTAPQEPFSVPYLRTTIFQLLLFCLSNPRFQRNQ